MSVSAGIQRDSKKMPTVLWMGTRTVKRICNPLEQTKIILPNKSELHDYWYISVKEHHEFINLSSIQISLYHTNR